MKGYPDRVQMCTTTHFDGVIAVIDPERSWVATWQRISTSGRPLSSGREYNQASLLTETYVRGMYGVRVKGRVPEDVEAELEARGIRYRPRDQSEQD